MLKITLKELLALKPCFPKERKALFGRRKTMDVATALKRGATIHDILWAAAKVGRRDLCIKFALACAVRAEKFDKTGTAKSCNDATAAYVADPSPANLETLRGKRQAANAAAYVTNAYSTNAPYATNAAADAAAHAAAANAAAYAAADAATAYAAYATNAYATNGYVTYATNAAATDAAYAANAAAYAAANAANDAATAFAAARKNEVMWQKRALVRIFK